MLFQWGTNCSFISSFVLPLAVALSRYPGAVAAADGGGFLPADVAQLSAERWLKGLEQAERGGRRALHEGRALVAAWRAACPASAQRAPEQAEWQGQWQGQVGEWQAVSRQSTLQLMQELRAIRHCLRRRRKCLQAVSTVASRHSARDLRATPPRHSPNPCGSCLLRSAAAAYCATQAAVS